MVFSRQIAATLLFGLASLGFSGFGNAQPILEGTYQTEGWSHYDDSKFTITSWGPHYILSADLARDGRLYEVELRLTENEGNRYEGSGHIIVRYSETTGCLHRFAGIVYVYENRIYLRENTPRHIPYNPNGACSAAGPYIWFDHPEPYYRLR